MSDTIKNDNLHGIAIDLELGVAFLPLEQADHPEMEHLRGVVLAWLDEVRAAERASIVAWLMAQARECFEEDDAATLEILADAIESGEHRGSP